MRSVYINNVTSFLPNAPVGNEEMEDYIGLIGGKPSRVQSLETPRVTDTIDLATQKYMFFSRSFCSGLFSSIYILPDGQVTMCEQLYWNKDFIVGNVLHNSLLEVWNSAKANSIYYLKQKDILSDSTCHSYPL